MAKTLQFRRGTSAELNAITGAEGELFVDLDTDTIRVHDGVTLGGVTLVNQAALNIKVNSTGGGYANNAITRYDGTTGTVIQNSLVTIADTGAITAPNNTSSMIPFYYDNINDFPVATQSHGAVAHAHNTGKLYYAHGVWIELANMTDVGSGGSSYNQDLNTTDSVTFDSVTVTSSVIIPAVDSVVVGGTSWSSGGNLITARSYTAGAGTQDAGLVFGGFDVNYDILNSTEEYDGATWSSGGNLITGKYAHAGAGTQTAALAFDNTTEEYDGTSWSSGGNLITSRISFAGAGTQTAALAFGGNNGLSSTEEYDGTNWSSGGNLITGRAQHGGAGTQTAALAFGGGNISASFSTEEYDGTSWSSGGNLITTRFNTAGAGTQTAALAFGGTDDTNFSYLSSTEEYDGTSWSSGGNLNAVRDVHAGAGTQSAALAIGGESYGSVLASTEEYGVSIQLPASTGTVGEIRYNEHTGVFEGYTGTQWVALSTAV